jgi:hypothetical protein
MDCVAILCLWAQYQYCYGKYIATSIVLMSTLPCASIEAGASIEAPFDPPTNYRNIELFQK